ncbi:MAG: dTDP-glucose pyrophosphorylase [Bacteroidetes bacterium]|nr:dTDP-glucose pyrophosphorylase [Bacteroidota bacterium]
MSSLQQRITGVIPAAGYASRLPKTPCSKEIFPLSVNVGKDHKSENIQIASGSLLTHLSLAGVDTAFMIIRKEKWDIPQLLEDGSDYNLNLSFIVTPPTSGTIYSICKSLPFIRNEIVLLGFPDIQIYSENPYKPLLDKLTNSDSDVVLGLFKASNPGKMDMVNLNHDGSLKEIEIKPNDTRLTLTWLIAVWKPSFTKSIQECLSDLKTFIKHKKIYLGDVFCKSIEKGCRIQTYKFRNTGFIDLGTVPDLKKGRL